MKSKKSPEPLQIEPLLLRAERAAALCGLAVSTWYSLMSSGQLPPSIKLGRARLWRLDTLRKWTQLNCPPIDRFTQLIKEDEK
jgi:predicted DNA-binding transcriptional regulator AlpA